MFINTILDRDYMNTCNEQCNEYNKQLSILMDKLECSIREDIGKVPLLIDSNLYKTSAKLRNFLRQLQDRKSMPWFKNFRQGPQTQMDNTSNPAFPVELLRCCDYASAICINIMFRIPVNVCSMDQASPCDTKFVRLKNLLDSLSTDAEWFKKPLVRFCDIVENM